MDGRFLATQTRPSMSEETSTTLLEAPESLELGVLELGVLEGPDSGRHWRIGPGRVRIGSGPRWTSS